MANDKREQDLGHDGLVLWTPFVEASRKIWGSLFDQLSDEVRSHQYDLFKAGHDFASLAAARSEWKAIETVEDLPKRSDIFYITTTSGEVVKSAFYCGAFDKDAIAWMPNPKPQPYQRPSREGK